MQCAVCSVKGPPNSTEFLKSISIHFNCSFMQLKQQTSSVVNGEMIDLDENQIAAMCFWIPIFSQN